MTATLNPFAPYKPPKGVVPDGDPILAMDDASGFGAQDWARDSMTNVASAEGQAFVGFPTLSLLFQRAEYRVISEIIATEMVRKWIKVKALDESDKTEKIKKIEAEFTRLGVRECFREAAEQDGGFGRSHLFLDFGEYDDTELRTPIGDGTDDKLNKLKIAKGSLKSMRVIEPVWVYPQDYNSTNPLRDDWYKPKVWYVLGKMVDASRLLTFIGREVPDLLKPSYAFAGISMSQMAIPYVTNWLDRRQGTTDIVKSFSVFVLGTVATDVLGGGTGADFNNRIDFFNATRDNRGMFAIDKEQESFSNVAAPLGGLDHLEAQAQEHMAAVSRIPLVKLLGISPTGLNASSEGELQVFADHILAYQEALFRPNLTTVLRIVQLSLFGEVDPQIGFEFGELVELTKQERADLRKSNAETGEILVRAKAVSSNEERKRVIKDQDGPYQDLAADDNVEFPMTEAEKATVATQVATTAAALVAEGIIEIPDALREIKSHSKVTGFGLEITDKMITEAEKEAASMPSPADLLAASAAGPPKPGQPDQPGDDPEAPSEPPKAAAGANNAPIKPTVTVGSKPIA